MPTHDPYPSAFAGIAPPLSGSLRVRLSIMMFLQYAIWGAWLPLLWPFLNGHRGFSASEIGDMFAVGAVGAIIAPFVAGQIADRYFNTEKFLAISHIVGGVLIWQLSWMEGYWAFLGFALAYSVVYSPTLPLTNSLAFHHLPDRDRDFGTVRVWGTIGWIVVGIAIGQWLLRQYTPDVADPALVQAEQWRGMADAFKLSGILGVAMGIFCLTLPRTPPTTGKQNNATFEALGEVKRQPLLTLFLLAVPISCIHQFYFVHTAGFLGQFQTKAATAINSVFGVGGGGLMTVGQMSEVLVLAAIPLVAKTLSRKALLGIGIAAYALRMALFAYGPGLAGGDATLATILVVLGIAMHGLCFGCFIFVAFMVVDEETTADVRASAQSLFNLVIIGIGIIVGSKVAGWVADGAMEAVLNADGQPVTDAAGEIVETLNFTKLFSVPMWIAVACLAALIVAYPGGRRANRPPH